MLHLPNFGNYKQIHFTLEGHRITLTEVHGKTYWWFIYLDGGDLCGVMKYAGEWTLETDIDFLAEKKNEIVEFLISYYQ